MLYRVAAVLLNPKGACVASWVTVLFALTIPAIAASAPKEDVLHSFGCTPDACAPQATVVFDQSGHLYGTTSGGGGASAGAVYELSRGPRGWSESVINSFTEPDGGSSAAPLIVDHSGNLYGTTVNGGAHDWGVVFQLTSSSGVWNEAVLYSFCSEGGGYCSDGESPWAGVVMDKSGNLFGLTREGGYSGVGGVAFELTPSAGGWVENVLHSFSRRPGDVGVPYFAPVFDKEEEHLYGTGEYGGAAGFGGVFQFSPTVNGGWKERVVLRFNGAKDGSHPYGGLVFDSAGNLYGTTNEYGPTGQGTVFKLSTAAHGHWKETVLYTFPQIANGGYPIGTLAIDKNGALYGIAGGGNNCSGDACGVVYKLAPQAHDRWKYSVLHKFNGSDGMWPQGGVILDKQQKHLYGTTEYGGAYGYGVVFEITP